MNPPSASPSLTRGSFDASNVRDPCAADVSASSRDAAPARPSVTASVTATAVCALYDPHTGRLRWARAGHLPPVVVSGADKAALPLTRGTLLGAWPDLRYEEAEILLQPNDILLMYTDGLVERRDTAWHISVDHLIATVPTPAESLGALLDALLTYSRSDTDDDTCLIGVQILAPGAP